MVCIPKQILCGGAHAQGLSSVMPLNIGRDVLQRATHHTSSPLAGKKKGFFIFHLFWNRRAPCCRAQ